MRSSDRRNREARSKSEGGLWANRGLGLHCSGKIVAVAECRAEFEPVMAGVAGAPVSRIIGWLG